MKTIEKVILIAVVLLLGFLSYMLWQKDKEVQVLQESRTQFINQLSVLTESRIEESDKVVLQLRKEVQVLDTEYKSLLIALEKSMKSGAQIPKKYEDQLKKLRDISAFDVYSIITGTD